MFTPDEATAMAEAGADILVLPLGLTTKGSIGATTAMSLDDAVAAVQAMYDAAKRVRPDIIVLCLGGPIAEPDDAADVLEHVAGITGFFGASSTERLPVETAIEQNMRRFKSLTTTTTAMP